MEDDSRPLLSSEQTGEDYLQRDSTNSLDFRTKRPFHVERKNIINDGPQETVSAEAAVLNSRLHYYSRLMGSSDRQLSPPDHVIPQPDEIYIYSPLGTAFKVPGSDHTSKNPSIITIFAIWNTMMGTSILSMPWGIKQAGFTLGVFIVIFIGLLMLYCCYIVLKSPKSIPCVDTSDWEFPDVCQYYFGKVGQWSSLMFSMVSLVGAMVVYWVLMSNFLFNTGQFIYNHVHNINVSDSELETNGSEKVICPYPNTNPGGNNTISTLYLSDNGNMSDVNPFERYWSKTNTVPFYLIILLLPLLCLRSASFFARFTFLGTISVVYLIVLVTVKAVRLGFHLEFHWFDKTEFYVPEFRLLFPQLTGVLTLAFFIHNCIITLMKNNKDQENNVRDLSVAYLLVGLTYLYVGVLIFAAFPSPPLFKDCIQPNFLDNFPSSDIMVFVARTFLLFQMITVYPLLGYLVRVQMMGQLFGNHYPSFLHVLILNILIVGAGVLMATFYPNIGSIIRFSGAICGLALVFVFPALVHMITLRRQGMLRWTSAISHSLLILLGVANLVAQFFM
ncbi:neutral amino acid transporter 9 isoform X1 [Oreochromis niloticus]|uniref:Neutral amino acid transporter 9 n=2 Tax=Oreochromis TaxID=8139 RepID=I3K0I5_ORENI|nr:sodium-coupled neutral amino acid transporter 9 isoform X1 [Oreochromis niloticus]XP_019216275.1 sodium-coupled neutral amino acid transporter 9 isoform X1 [Oreochromis niloticus]XP_019216276.1 sodium-coupled neutral amino acid transporter 9 isoform X1 [Oreochromis niloticus]XP_031594273.1 sodium-coupled neutral amino acid transporter 9 isoform X1 [Oreochromis aureus]XP_031594274.1 sodium-coupled neutral amino acid transporter 9 isoform X1 [Oreochromis aureus]XP_039471386.1 sodium-coupled n